MTPVGGDPGRSVYNQFQGSLPFGTPNTVTRVLGTLSLLTQWRILTPPTPDAGGWNVDAVWEKHVLTSDRLNLSPVASQYDEYSNDIVVDVEGLLSAIPTWALEPPKWMSLSGAGFPNGYLFLRDEPTAARTFRSHPFMLSRIATNFASVSKPTGSPDAKLQPFYSFWLPAVSSYRDLTDGSVWMWYGHPGGYPFADIPTFELQAYVNIVGGPGTVTAHVVAYYRGYEATGETVLQSWDVDMPAFAGDVAHGLHQVFTATNTPPASALYVRWAYSFSSSSSGVFAVAVNGLAAYVPTCLPGATSDHITGARVPCGYLVQAQPPMVVPP
jgi:hypothetical protein